MNVDRLSRSQSCMAAFTDGDVPAATVSAGAVADGLLNQPSDGADIADLNGEEFGPVAAVSFAAPNPIVERAG